MSLAGVRWLLATALAASVVAALLATAPASAAAAGCTATLALAQTLTATDSHGIVTGPVNRAHDERAYAVLLKSPQPSGSARWLTYATVVTNTSGCTDRGAVMEDQVPFPFDCAAGRIGRSTTTPCSGTGASVSILLGTIAAHATQTVYLSGTFIKTGSGANFSNLARVGSNDAHSVSSNTVAATVVRTTKQLHLGFRPRSSNVADDPY
jgi:hypothetical protein